VTRAPGLPLLLLIRSRILSVICLVVMAIAGCGSAPTVASSPPSGSAATSTTPSAPSNSSSAGSPSPNAVAACPNGTVESYIGTSCSQGATVTHWSSFTCTSTPSSICPSLGTNGANLLMMLDPNGPVTFLVGRTSLWNVTAEQRVDVVIGGTIYGADGNQNWPHFNQMKGGHWSARLEMEPRKISPQLGVPRGRTVVTATTASAMSYVVPQVQRPIAPTSSR